MKKLMMLSLAAATLVAGAAYATDTTGSAAGDKLRDAAANADKAAVAKNAQLGAAADVSNEQVKADVEANAAVKADGVTDTVKHRAKQAGHKIKQAGAKVEEKYHGAVAEHYDSKAAADVSASLNVGK